MTEDEVTGTELALQGSVMQATGFGKLADWGFTPQQTGVITSLDMTTIEGRMLAFKMSQGNGRKADDVANLEMEVVGYFITAIQLESEEGEILTVPLTRLVHPDGTWTQTTGKKVCKDLMGYSLLVRQAPWNPPMRCKLVKMPSKKNPGGYHSLQILDGAEVLQQPASKGRKR